jgi:hypothetical protein
LDCRILAKSLPRIASFAKSCRLVRRGGCIRKHLAELAKQRGKLPIAGSGSRPLENNRPEINGIVSVAIAAGAGIDAFIMILFPHKELLCRSVGKSHAKVEP